MIGISFSLSSYTAPRVACLGGEVALFSRPFEACPTDPVRREVYKHQSGASTPWFSPEAVPVSASSLRPSHQWPAGPIPRAKRARR